MIWKVTVLLFTDDIPRGVFCVSGARRKSQKTRVVTMSGQAVNSNVESRSDKNHKNRIKYNYFVDRMHKRNYINYRKKFSENIFLTKGANMTIKEIAKLSNVSISTVSKILNGKDSSISGETREKVLRIARDYHYAPYEKSGSLSRFLIGVVIQDSSKGRMLLSGISRAARKNGYGIFCCEYSQEPESERKAVAAMCAQGITAVIWQRNGKESMEYLSCFEEKETEVFFCDFLDLGEGERQFTLDYGRYGYEAARCLADWHHRRIGCCIREDNERTDRFVKGFQRCLYDRGLEKRPDFVMVWNETREFCDISLYGITGLVCQNEEIAADICRKASERGYKIPKDLSLITLSECRERRILYPKMTSIYLPIEELGEYACSQVIAVLEKREGDPLDEKIEILEGDSTGEIPDHSVGKIVVVGSINMDSIISVRTFPEAGQTGVAEEFQTHAGGKGFNQAVGAARLGAEAVLIGKIGQDYEAKILREAMAGYGISVEGILESTTQGTGRAYITVQKNGESNIIVYSGANRFLTKEDLQRKKSLFAGAQFCLLQLETPMEIVEYAADIAGEMGSRRILKPAAVDTISDSLLKKIDIFVPNRKELDLLCPIEGTLEEKAQYFLDKGVGQVIVTLDEDGCLWVNDREAWRFRAADFEAVDTTGAADAFIAALAVYLSEGFPMKLAIQYATYAAGFSITRNGVPASMVDRSTMDIYTKKITETILYEKYDKE